MPYKKGQSGNPKGRPPKSRALTDLLEKSGSTKITSRAGKSVAQRQVFVDRIWEGLTTGKITFAAGVAGEVGATIALDGADFIALAKLVFSQTDGPPKGALDVTSNGKDIGGIVFEYMPGRDETDATRRVDEALVQLAHA